MKRLIYLLLLLLSLSACGASTGTDEPQGIVSGDTSPYQLLVSSSDMTQKSTRLVLTLWDGPQRLTDAQALDVEIYSITSSGDSMDKVWQGAARSYTLDTLQYWVAYPDFPQTGNYGVRVVVTNKEGEKVDNQAILEVKEKAEAPDIGDTPPRSQTRTLEDAPIEELTSAGPYVERFYELSVAQAIESEKAAIIAFSTPAFCTSALCAPVMGTLETVGKEVDDKFNIVHVEVWRDFNKNELEPAITEWALPSEPWLFILNPDGTVGARLDGPVSVEELRETIAQVTE